MKTTKSIADKEIQLRLAAAGVARREITPNPKKIKDLKYKVYQETLDSVGGHRAKAAEILGIHKATLYRWLKDSRNATCRTVHGRAKGQ